MAKKTVSSVIKDATPQATNGNGGSHPLAIDELNLLRLTRAAEKGRAAGLELQLASNAMNGMFQRWLQQDEEAKKLNQRIVELQAEAKKAQDDYSAVIVRISSEMKIDLKEYSYDDETGVLHKLTAAPAPANPGKVEEPAPTVQ